MLLAAPNGVIADASDSAVPALLAFGWRRVARPKPQPQQRQDLSALTVAQLKALCDGRGIGYPRKATKATLVALLEE